MDSTAPQPAEGRFVPWWIPLSILLVVLIVAAGLGLLAAQLH